MNAEQDFTRRMIIVVRKDIEPWQVTNAVGHIAAYLGNKMPGSFDTGSHFVTKDSVQYPRNSQYPIITKLAKSSEQLHNLFTKVCATNLLHIAFIREMIDHTDDAHLQESLKEKESTQVEYLGVGMFGDDEEVDKLTKKFSLYS